MLTPHLPKQLNKEAWADVILTDTIVTFSKYFYHKIRFVVNDETCFSRVENGVKVYYIKDEYLQGLVLLGVMDIDWTDFSADNLSVSQTAGYGYYTPEYVGCISCSFETLMGYQMAADMTSLYNRGIFIEFQDPNKLILTNAINTTVDLKSFVVDLLVQHPNLLFLQQRWRRLKL